MSYALEYTHGPLKISSAISIFKQNKTSAILKVHIEDFTACKKKIYHQDHVFDTGTTITRRCAFC